MKSHFLTNSILAASLALSTTLAGAQGFIQPQPRMLQQPDAMALSSNNHAPTVHLKGQYAYTGEGSCLYSPSGFDPVTLVPLGFSSNSSFSVTGVWTWDGQGNSALTATIVSLAFSPSIAGTAFNPSASTIAVKATFKSSGVYADGSFTEDMQSFKGTFTSGSRASQYFTFDNGHELAYQSADGRTLTMATTAPDIQTQNIYSSTGVLLATQQRICHGSRTMVKLR